MEKLNSPHPAIKIPSKSTPVRVSFKDYLNNNSFLIHQCEDADVLFHVSFVTAAHAIEKAMLYLQREPSFDSLRDAFSDCNSLIFAYQTKWLNTNADESWRKDTVKIAGQLCPTIPKENVINEAVHIYMDKYFLFDIIYSELRRIIKLDIAAKTLIIKNGIPYLKRNIVLAELDLILLKPAEKKINFPLSFSEPIMPDYEHK